MSEYPKDLGSRFTLADLPEEMLRQLRLTSSPLTMQGRVLDALHQLGGTATLNEILVMIYRSHGIIEKREAMDKKLSAMGRAGEIIRPSRGVFQVKGDQA